MGKHHPVASQLVEMGRPDTAASIGIERFNSQVVGEDQDDVGFVLSLPKGFVAWQSIGWRAVTFF